MDFIVLAGVFNRFTAQYPVQDLKPFIGALSALPWLRDLTEGRELVLFGCSEADADDRVAAAEVVERDCFRLIGVTIVPSRTRSVAAAMAPSSTHGSIQDSCWSGKTCR